jgi:cytochrome c oxidase subunit 2
MAAHEESKLTDPRNVSYAVPMLIIGAIASALGVALALLIDWMPIQASVEAEKVDTFWDILLICSVPIFVLVCVVVGYSIWKFRMRPGEENLDGPPIHGNTMLEVVWTAIPALMMLALSAYAYVVLTDIEEAKADQLNVRVVGEQFTWTFFYRTEGGEEQASPELVVPINRQVRFTVQSKDVLHDFWVPEMRMKIDAVPGKDTHVMWTAKREGTYPVVCAELCGLGHATMRQDARVVPAAEFDEFVANLGQPQEEEGGGQAGGGGEEGGGGGQAADGKTLFTSVQPTACGACHTLSDAGTTGTTGPNLDENLQGKDADYIRESITNPSATIAPGFQNIMPPYNLPPEELDALVNYLVEVAGK